ncbi:MAG: TolB-like 6-bladed beta-propeller domain-containing protein [Prevotellaceae bacterium]|jgi:hypothetical protein|nr:TolB-like 6-bladed beta-propeller domain-containing protein [Prevotellaceae bacterium]
MKIKVLIYILLSIFVACGAPVSKEKVAVITEFPVTKELKADTVRTAPVILDTEAMFIMDDRIYIIQTKKDTLFDVFDLNDCRYLRSVGTRGGGPNEFLFPNPYSVQVHGSQFTLYDRAFMRTVEIPPNGSLQIVKSEKIFDVLPVNDFVCLNDSLYCAVADCATGTTGDLEYRMKNMKNGKEIKFSEYPDLLEQEYTGELRCKLYQKCSTANAEHGKFAAFYCYCKYIRIYNISSEMEIEKEVHVNIPPFKQTGNMKNYKERKLFYTQVFSTDKYIYARCAPNEIQVWDWDGNPVISYLLDQTSFWFAISEKTKKIYTVNFDEENWDKFFVYDLSHL